MLRSVVLIMLSFFSVILFYLDIHGYFSRPQAPVATLEAATGIVRRLSQGQLSWDRLEKGSLFGSKDIVSTGEHSYAKIHFLEGAELDLDPGSMIVVGDTIEEVKLNFVSGSGQIRIARSASKKISVAEKGETLLSSRSKIEFVDDISATARKIAEFKPESRAFVSEQNLRKIAPVFLKGGKLVSTFQYPTTPTIKSPENDGVLETGKGRLAFVEWSLPESSGEKTIKPVKYEVQFRSSANKVKVKTIISDQLSAIISEIKPGKYLWSVRGISASGRRGPSSLPRWVEVVELADIAKPKVYPVKVESTR